MTSPAATRPAAGPLTAWLLPAAVAAGGPAALWGLRASAGAGRPAFEAALLYWTMTAVVGVWLLVALARWRSAGVRLPAALRERGPGIALALLLAGLVVVVAPPSMRVQFDETSLVGVSQNLHLHRAATMTTAAIPFDGAVMALESTIDKRPPLFPFLVALVHDATGYRIANAFAVNAALLALLLAAVHSAVRRWLGAGCAVAAQLLLVGTPLLPVVATSAGFELLAGLLLVVVVTAAIDVAREPTPARALWFLGNGLLFAWSRYESVLLFLLLAGLVLWRTRGAGASRAVRWLAAALPGLLLPLGFLFLHARRPDFYPEALGQPLVALRHGFDHLGPFAAAFFGGGLATPWPGFVAAAGAVAWLLRLARRAAGFGDALVALPVAAATAIALCWFYGDVREASAQRLFLPAALLFALAPLAAARRAGGVVPAAWFVALALPVAALRLVALQRGEAFPRLQTAAVTDAIDDALRAVPADAGRTLWVTFAAQHLVVKGRAAMSAEAFARRSADVQQLIAGRHLQRLYVLETPLDGAFAAAFGSVQELLAGMRSEVVWRAGGGVPITVHRVLW